MEKFPSTFDFTDLMDFRLDLHHVRQESHEPCALNGLREFSLMPCAHA